MTKNLRLKPQQSIRTLAAYVADITSDSIIITDTNQLILYVNPAFSQTTGYTSNEIIGKTPSVLKSGKHPKRFYKKMWDTLLKGNIFKNVMINKNKSGDIIYEEKVIIPVRDKEGKITHYVSTGRDITGRIVLLQKLKKKKILLEQSKKDLETFVYKASHNLRGPVASIMGIASMFHEEIIDEKALQYCNFVQSCAQNLDEVLKSMLHLQLVCKKESRNDRINFVELIKKIKSSYSKYEGFDQTDFVVSCNLKEEFISNKKMMDSLFQNIMHNTVKFRKLDHHKRNRVVINIADHKKDIKIEIKDTGIGIKQQHIPRVFDMYYKANNTHKGSGLGLYFARQIVNNLGGRISIKSKITCCTTIMISLPKK